jgi:hypothetical protein
MLYFKRKSGDDKNEPLFREFHLGQVALEAKLLTGQTSVQTEARKATGPLKRELTRMAETRMNANVFICVT